MVVDPSYESIRLSEKVCDMGRALGKPVYLILNKVDKDQADMIKSTIRDREAVIAEIPSEPEIMKAGLTGEPLDIEIPEVETVLSTLSGDMI